MEVYKKLVQVSIHRHYLYKVWRFLINFADVLGLWPFMLDEFIQTFHDYDPRLLGEIHGALLRSIIKDIEDVARTPSSTGLGVNQNAAANPGGGHPQIVDGVSFVLWLVFVAAAILLSIVDKFCYNSAEAYINYCKQILYEGLSRRSGGLGQLKISMNVKSSD